MPADDPPSDAELEFLAMLKRPREYARWAAGVRSEWERAQVLWFHGFRGGKAVWLAKRPEPSGEEYV